ncbi:MAG: YidC/Oxa1 family membrane protein insertase [Clostridia bacterium]|nr:YidC/Oxa1 family membrane protein insertase [Clostridia bacterium]
MTDFLGLLAEGMKYLMIFCDQICRQHYWLSLLLFALIIKLVLFPFGIIQQKSQQKLAKLRPKEEAIRRKYRDKTDQESQRKMQEEIMAMYREEKYSQFSGCLPMLLQLPVLFSLYYIIQNPLHYVCRFGKPQIEVISDTYNWLTGTSSVGNLTIKATSFLSTAAGRETLINALPLDGTVPDGAGFANYADFRADLITQITEKSYPNYKMFGFIDLSVTPSEMTSNVHLIWYILVPIITFAILWGTTKLQKKFMYQSISAESQQSNPSMKIMEYMMPLMSAVFAFTLPSALALYWVYQNVLGFGQQVLLSKLFPAPKMTDAELKEALREADRQAYEVKKAEEKRKKSIHDEDVAMSSMNRGTGIPEGWVEPMGPSSVRSDEPAKPKGKKNRAIDKAEMKNDKKGDE